MAIDTYIPEQRSGEGVRTEPLVVDDKMLNEGDEDVPPLRPVLDAVYGEQGRDWKTIPHTASKMYQWLAPRLKLELYEIEVIDEGQPRVLQQTLSQMEAAPRVGAYIPRQFTGSGEDRILLTRSNTRALNQTTLDGPPLRDLYTEIYGPETDPDQPDSGGWFVETDLPRSDEEHVELHMGKEPVEVYLTIGGLKRAVER